MEAFRLYRNREDPAERLKARPAPRGGYEVRTPEGDEVSGNYPEDVFEAVYEVVNEAEDASA